MTTATKYETRSVLAGAYKAGRKNLQITLTHLALVDGGNDEAICGRAPNLADRFAMTDAERAARPTCPKCARVWDREHASEVQS